MIRNLWMVLMMAGIMCLLVAPVGAQTLSWDIEEPLFSTGKLDGQQGWTSVNPDENYVDSSPAYVLDGDQSVMAYMGANIAAKYTMNDFGFTETLTQFSFLAASLGGEALQSEMRVYLNDAPWAGIWARIFLSPTGIYALGGQTQAGCPHPRVRQDLGAFVYGDIYSFTVGFNFIDHTYTVAAENLTDPTQVLTTQTLYMAEDYCLYPVTLEAAGNSTIWLACYAPGSGGLARDMWDNVSMPTIPEPSALLALASGLVALAGVRIRRRR